MTRLSASRIVLALSIMSLSACQTIKMPKIDIMEQSEFEADAANIGKVYPKVSEAPVAPSDIRSDKQWDADARELQVIGNTQSEIDPVDPLTNAEVDARYQDLRAKAKAYKLDDPAGGID